MDMKIQNNDIEYCKKCGRPTPVLISNLDQEEQGHITRYCGDCGTPYEYILVDLGVDFSGEEEGEKMAHISIEDKNDFLLYKKIFALYKLYFVENYNNPLSAKANEALRRFAKYSLIQSLNRDFIDDEKQKNQIDDCSVSLTHLYEIFLLFGYCGWIVEHPSPGEENDKLVCPNWELFEDECMQTVQVIYPDYIQSIKTSQNSKSISSELSRVLETFVKLHFEQYFDRSEDLRLLKDISDNIQAYCFQATVLGYSIGLVDARYRK